MKKFIKLTALAAAMAFSTSVLANIEVTPMKNVQTVSVTESWDKTFPQSDKVDHQKVQFRNRYGITLVGDLYMPKGAKGKLPAIVVSGPFGAVKEQSSGIYAQELAERGFVTLAFDGSFTGESGGEVRNLASPEINTEDFSAAVDFLTLQAFVNPDEIGILGICGWGGFALNAAATDTRIKATATSTMYDMSRVMANGYNDSVNAEQRYQTRQTLNAQRTEDAKSGNFAPNNNNLPEKLTGNEPQFVQNYWNYYKTPRGFHPRSINSNGAWTATSPLPFVSNKLLDYAAEIKNPVLLVHGENAHSRYFSEGAFKKLTGDNKELFIVKGADHVDLYDKQAGKIPFDKFEQFFKANLK
ncbi:alpha/beta hydrolase [Pasteurellaceae bacterium LIM206]|nr:alpha/beta hydrolase [Pasteurellaceae bacterium LIM206]